MKINNNIDEKSVVIGGALFHHQYTTEIFQLDVPTSFVYAPTLLTIIWFSSLFIFGSTIISTFFEIINNTIESLLSTNTFRLFVHFKLSSVPNEIGKLKDLMS